MSISEKTLRTLEFDKICSMLETFCETEGAAAMARHLRPSDDRHTVLRLQRRTTDARRLADVKGAPSFGRVRDVSSACERAEKGAVLSQRELLDCAGVLYTARTLQDYHLGNHPFDTVLDEIFDRLIPNRALEERIRRAIPAEDIIADEASALLSDIRRKIRNENAKIKETLQRIISGNAKYLQENLVTMRGGRYVIPVKAECKSEVRGLIHDTSSTGATIFVEPMAVVEANNEIRMLETKEEREIERILSELSAAVGEVADALWLDFRNINELAFAFACGELSAHMKAVSPTISEDRAVNLMEARHPLIDKNAVVPINISLGGEFDTLVITGPNTGGKTVSLKTVGLFALMTQSGLHIPAAEDSRICIYDRILVDLGDEQSIEQSLSTFSSHMVNIVSIMEEVGPHSLVLFDELGGGTDPVEGAALAVAIIESVREEGACCVATTHYAELKAYALDTEGVCNASCEFDVETLKPTYKLIIGAPGKSNAFAISEKLGLSRAIIERARGMVSSENRTFEGVIEQLETARVQMEHERAEAQRLREEFERFRAEAEATIRERVENAEREAETIRQRSAAMVQSARASCDFLYEQMERMRRAQESERAAEELAAARRAAREHLRAHGDMFDPIESEEDEGGEGYVLPRPLRKGDKVRIVTIHQDGEVVEEPRPGAKLILVRAGVVSTKVRPEDLRLVDVDERGRPKKPTQKQKVPPKSSVTIDRSHGFKTEIDLRGMTGEEAWLEVDRYLDSAVLAGIQSVHLIHGKGTGALRNALWKFLRGDKRVASFRIGKYGEGDGGVTVVELK